MRLLLLGTRNILVVLSLIVFAVTSLASGQEQDTEPSPRTAWGDPDLQGIWNNNTITPLQRPAEFADREFLTTEQAAEIERQAVARVAEQNAPSTVRTEPLPAGGNVGAYNSYWTEQGTRIVPTGRTSLITDPPNGRLPQLTSEALARITSAENRRIFDAREGLAPAHGPEDMGLSERCLWYRGIPTFPTGYNNNYHIVQNLSLIHI